jgi:transporter family-2 protein
MIFGLVFVAVLIGAMMPLQAGINAELTRFLKHPFLGAFLSFAIGTLALIGITLLQGFPTQELKRLPSAPPWLFVGGILGAVFVASSIYLIPRLGATAMIGAFVTGQLLMSIAVDHYGFFGIPSNPVTWSRALGVILLFGGLLLVLKK